MVHCLTAGPFGKQKVRPTMPTDPAILAQLQTLWGEPVTEATAEVDAESAIVASEFLPRPTAPAPLADSPPTWNAEAAELVTWFQTAGDSLPVEPFDLCSGCRVVEPARFYGSLRSEIATGPIEARARLGTLQADLRRLRSMMTDLNRTARVSCQRMTWNTSDPDQEMNSWQRLARQPVS